MRGREERPDSLFSYVRADHPLRPIRALADEVPSGLNGRFETLYSGMGRPSSPPEMLLRATLLQAFFSVRSERMPMERIDDDLLFRWPHPEPVEGCGVGDGCRDLASDGVHAQSRPASGSGCRPRLSLGPPGAAAGEAAPVGRPLFRRRHVDRGLGEHKAQAGLAKVKPRSKPKVEAVFAFAAAAYDLVRLPKLLAKTEVPPKVTNPTASKAPVAAKTPNIIHAESQTGLLQQPVDPRGRDMNDARTPTKRKEKHLRRGAMGMAVAASLGLFGEARAYDLPAVNLGLTSFLDGAPPSGPGWYPMQYLQVYSAGKLTDNRGRSLGLPRENADVLIGVSQLLYFSPIKLGPGAFGLDIIMTYLPYASMDDGLGGAVLKAKDGFGDMFVGPFYQFDPIMGDKGPVFLGRIEAQFIIPTGSYDPTSNINPGANFWSFNPNVAGTVFLTPDWTVSGRFHYLWNASNDRPNVGFGSAVLTTQAGQAVHANFASEFSITKEIKLGANGYFLQQITDTLANGVSVPGRRERVFAAGPGAMYSINKDNFLFFNAFYEFGAQNRTEGQRYTMRWVGHFN